MVWPACQEWSVTTSGRISEEPIPWRLEAAAILAALVHHWADFIIILDLLLANALVGFWESQTHTTFRHYRRTKTIVYQRFLKCAESDIHKMFSDKDVQRTKESIRGFDSLHPLH